MKLPNRKDYSNIDEYLSAVYEKNKSIISKAYEGIKNKKEAFIIQIKQRKIQESNLNIKSVIKKELHRDIYIPESEKFKENVIQGLKTFKEFNKFQVSLRDKKGRFVKFDANNINYIGNNQYSYEDNFGNVFVIDFSNSPKQIKIYDLRGK